MVAALPPAARSRRLQAKMESQDTTLNTVAFCLRQSACVEPRAGHGPKLRRAPAHGLACVDRRDEPKPRWCDTTIIASKLMLPRCKSLLGSLHNKLIAGRNHAETKKLAVFQAPNSSRDAVPPHGASSLAGESISRPGPALRSLT